MTGVTSFVPRASVDAGLLIDIPQLVTPDLFVPVLASSVLSRWLYVSLLEGAVRFGVQPDDQPKHYPRGHEPAKCLWHSWLMDTYSASL